MLKFNLIKRTIIKYLEGIPPTSSKNLAIFRIVVFASLLLEGSLPGNNILFFHNIPAELHYGWNLIFEDLVFSRLFTIGAYTLFATGCLLSIIGYQSKTTIPLTCLFATVALGVPHLYDNYNETSPHHHHLIWFAALLAFSPCAQSYSWDAKKQKKTEEYAVKYKIPIQIAGILIGIIYFFPGINKIKDWGLGSEIIVILKDISEHRYQETGGNILLTINQFPDSLIWLGGLSVIIFEISFIFLINFKRTRWLAVASGLFFHSLTFLFLKISFWPLVICYVIFFNWGRKEIGTILNLPRDSKLPPSFQITALSLILLNTFCGILKIDSWPFTIYPAFPKSKYQQEFFNLKFSFFDGDNHELTWDSQELIRNYGLLRWKHLERNVSRSTFDKTLKLQAISRLIISRNPDLNTATYFRVEDSSRANSSKVKNYPLKNTYNTF